MSQASVGEVVDGLWRFEALHPEWTEEEGGEDGWEQNVAWWAVRSAHGLVLIDPLVVDWHALDRLVSANGGCAGVIRSCHWHQRSISDVALRYGSGIWAKPAPAGGTLEHFDHAVSHGESLFDCCVGLDVERNDEIALWLPHQRALLFGDAMLRAGTGALRVCPESWLQPEGGRARLLAVLDSLDAYPAEHILVSHGPLVLGAGRAELDAALRSARAHPR